MLVVGIIMLVLGAAGTLVTLLFLMWVFGDWTLTVAVGFVIVGVIGALLISAGK